MRLICALAIGLMVAVAGESQACWFKCGGCRPSCGPRVGCGSRTVVPVPVSPVPVVPVPVAPVPKKVGDSGAVRPATVVAGDCPNGNCPNVRPATVVAGDCANGNCARPVVIYYYRR